MAGTKKEGQRANKRQLAERIASEMNLPIRTAMRTIDGVLDAIEHFVVDGDGVTIKGFGSFEAGVRKGRAYRHPVSGKSVETPNKPIVKFKAAKDLRARLGTRRDSSLLEQRAERDELLTQIARPVPGAQDATPRSVRR